MTWCVAQKYGKILKMEFFYFLEAVPAFAFIFFVAAVASKENLNTAKKDIGTDEANWRSNRGYSI